MHCLVFTIVSVLTPSQYTVFSVNVTPSLYRSLMRYPVIAEPPVTGRLQVTTTFVPLAVVVGAVGADGVVAAMIPKTEEEGP